MIGELKKDIKFSVKVLIGCSMLIAFLPVVTSAAIPKVIMTFDDGWVSVNNSAYKIMQNNNQTGVAFIYPQAIDGRWPEFLTIQQLNILTYAGWDISSHTFSHSNLTKVNPANLSSELTLSKAWLDTHGYPGSMFLAYPEGSYNNTVINSVKSQYVAARTVNKTGFPTYVLSGPTYTFSEPNPYNITNVVGSPEAYELKSYEIIGGEDDSNTVIAQINNVINQSGGTLILTFHKIVDILNTTTPETDFSVSDFTAVSDYLNANKDRVQVVTLSDYFNQPIPYVIIPPVVSYTNGSNWINVTYELGLHADDEAILTVNGTEKQNSSSKLSFFNLTGLPKHSTLNLAVIGRNSSSSSNATSVSKVIQTVNAPVLIDWNASIQTKNNSNITVVWNRTQIYVGEKFSIMAVAKDADGDNITFSTNATKAAIGSLNNNTGLFTLNNTTAADIGSYNWNITADDNYGSSASINFTIDIVKPVQTLSLLSTKGNFWVNWSFISEGLKPDYTAVFINGTEVQNGTATFYNTMANGSLNPHSTVNISVLAHNNTFGDLGNVWANDTQTLENNRACISGSCLFDISTDTWTIWEEYQIITGITLNLLPKVENLDNDLLEYALNLTNKTENTSIDYSINKSTGFITITNTSYLGFYNFTINVKDNYGSSDSVNFTIYIVESPVNSLSGWSGNNIGSGGGGGNVDIFDPNIESYERHDSQIRKDIESKVAFFNNDLISNITFYGRRNYGEVIVKASILKGNPTPKYIANAYKFFAIKLDTIREQEENQFISNTTITVHINKTNLSGNNVEVFRFKNDTWLPVVIEELPIEDDVNKYFNLKSDGLSNFVIVLDSKPSTTIDPEELFVSTMALIPQIETIPPQMISKIQESLYRVIINLIKRYMWWI